MHQLHHRIDWMSSQLDAGEICFPERIHEKRHDIEWKRCQKAKLIWAIKRKGRSVADEAWEVPVGPPGQP